MLRNYTYKFNEGPFNTEEELLGVWEIGNCRRAVQLYIYEYKGQFLTPAQVLCPESYKETGEFVSGNDKEFCFESLIAGDIIYAEGLRNKMGEAVDKSLPTYKTYDEHLTSLHTAIFTGEEGKEIWHATFIEGGTCYWSLEKFKNFYKPIAAKRI